MVTVTVFYDSHNFFTQGQVRTLDCDHVTVEDYAYISRVQGRYSREPFQVSFGDELEEGDPRAIRSLKILNKVLGEYWYVNETKELLATECESVPEYIKGDKGDMGLQGPAGPTGPQGPQGTAGISITGPQGPRGLQGFPGDDGPTGPQGDTGAQGDQGDTGPPGATGATGPAGTTTNASFITSGTLGDAFLSANVVMVGGTQVITGAKTFNDITLPATKISSGTLPDARLSANVPLMVAGIIPDANLSTNVVMLGGTQVITGTKTFTNITVSGTLTASLAATSLTGTIDDARLSANVVMLGGAQTITGTKTFTNVTVSGTLTASLAATSLTGTIDEARLSSNVMLLYKASLQTVTGSVRFYNVMPDFYADGANTAMITLNAIGTGRSGFTMSRAGGLRWDWSATTGNDLVLYTPGTGGSYPLYIHYTTGNVQLSGATTTDQGVRLYVNGASKFNGALEGQVAGSSFMTSLTVKSSGTGSQGAIFLGYDTNQTKFQIYPGPQATTFTTAGGTMYFWDILYFGTASSGGLSVGISDNKAIGTFGVGTSNVSCKGLVARGRSGQVGSLFECQDSTVLALLTVTAAGRLMLGSIVDSGHLMQINGTSKFTGAMEVVGSVSSVAALTVKGTTGATGVLAIGYDVTDTRFQIYTTSLSGIFLLSSGAQMRLWDNLNGAASSGGLSVGISENLAVGTFAVGTSGTSVKGIIIRGRASQAGNLLEIQDSASVAMMTVTAAANVLIGSVTDGGQKLQVTVIGSTEPIVKIENPTTNWTWGIGAGTQYAVGDMFFAKGTPTATNWSLKCRNDNLVQSKDGFTSSYYYSPVTGIGDASILKWTNTGGNFNGTLSIGVFYTSGVQNVEAVIGLTGTASTFRVRDNSNNDRFKVLADGTASTYGTLMLKAGTATVASVIIPVGVVLTTPVNGALEFDGTNFYITIGGVRKTVTVT